MNSREIVNYLIARLPDANRIEIEVMYDAPADIPEKHTVHFRWWGASIIAFSTGGEDLELKVHSTDNSAALARTLAAVIQGGPRFFRKRAGFDSAFSKQADKCINFTKEEVTRDFSGLPELLAEAIVSVQKSFPSLEALPSETRTPIYWALRRAVGELHTAVLEITRAAAQGATV